MNTAAPARPDGLVAAVARLLGANPAVFVPFARAYSLIVRRRSRLRSMRGAPARKGGRLSPFHLICLVAFFFGLMPLGGLIRTPGSLTGAATSITLGSVLVVFLILFDYLDVLANREEYLVIAAHPHDPWSVVLAKIFVVGRAVGVIALCYYAASIVAIGWTHSVLAATAFIAGAALASAVATLGASVLGIGILARGGRTALLTLLPWLQGIFLVGYFMMVTSRRWIGALAGLENSLFRTGWGFVPTAWFVAPLEWVEGVGTWATWARAGLILASFGALTSVGARWLREGFGEAIMDLGTRSVSRAARSKPRTAAAPRLRDPSMRALVTLLRAHLRTDLGFRSQLTSSIIAPAIMVFSTLFSPNLRMRTPEFPLLFGAAAMGLAIAGVGAALTSSSRLPALWTVLVSPVGRRDYAMQTRQLLRLLVMPFALILGGWYLVAAHVPLVERAIRVVGLFVYLEAILTLQRGIVSEFPFSAEPIRRRGAALTQVTLLLVQVSVAGGGALGLALAWYFGIVGAIVAVVMLVIVRAALEPWVRWRVDRAVGALEA